VQQDMDVPQERILILILQQYVLQDIIVQQDHRQRLRINAQLELTLLIQDLLLRQSVLHVQQVVIALQDLLQKLDYALQDITAQKDQERLQILLVQQVLIQQELDLKL
jgi:hypothetical protein